MGSFIIWTAIIVSSLTVAAFLAVYLTKHEEDEGASDWWRDV